MSSSDPFRHRSSKPSREVGDAPSLGQVPRMHKGSESRAGRRTRKSTISPNPKNTPPAAFGIAVLACLLAVGVLVAGLVLWVKRSQNKQVEGESNTPAAVATKRAASALAESPTEAEATKLVKKFLATREEEELADLIRPTSQEPAEIIRKLSELDKSDGKVSSLQFLGAVDSRSLQIEGVIVTFEGNRNRLALLSPDAAGKWRVDFDAFDRHVSPDWKTLLSGAAVTGRVRIFCSPDSYYNGKYRDDTKWTCYAMASPDGEDLLYGYLDKNSPQSEVMTKVFAANSTTTLGTPLRSKRLVLEIRHEPDANPRQFEITRVLSDEWSLGDTPLDEKLSRPLSAELK